MGRFRDELYDTMWDEVTCVKHNWVGACRRFSCPSCQSEVKEKKERDFKKAREILEPYGLSYVVGAWI